MRLARRLARAGQRILTLALTYSPTALTDGACWVFRKDVVQQSSGLKQSLRHRTELTANARRYRLVEVGVRYNARTRRKKNRLATASMLYGACTLLAAIAQMCRSRAVVGCVKRADAPFRLLRGRALDAPTGPPCEGERTMPHQPTTARSAFTLIEMSLSSPSSPSDRLLVPAVRRARLAASHLRK